MAGSGKAIRIENQWRRGIRREDILEMKAVTTVAKVIEFYIPNHFRRSLKWVSAEGRGKIIAFARPMSKSA